MRQEVGPDLFCSLIWRQRQQENVCYCLTLHASPISDSRRPWNKCTELVSSETTVLCLSQCSLEIVKETDESGKMAAERETRIRNTPLNVSFAFSQLPHLVFYHRLYFRGTQKMAGWLAGFSSFVSER